MKKMMSKQAEIKKYISYLKLEKKMLITENERNERLVKVCDSAIRYHEKELGLLNLIEFCNTGKYPE